MPQYFVLPLVKKSTGEAAAILNYDVVDATSPEAAFQQYITKQEQDHGSVTEYINGKQVVIVLASAVANFLYNIAYNGYTATKAP